jgi:hypothetical protein
MPLWGSVDNAANSDIAVLMQYNKPTDTTEQAVLFGNTTSGAFVTNETVGQFGVDSDEITAARAAGAAKPAHAGWNIRHEGTGLKAGRVWYETVVAMGSMSGDDEDTVFPDTTIRITTQPVSANGAGNVTLSVVATSTPTKALSYAWESNDGTGWVSVGNLAGVYYNSTSATLTANAAVANANTFRVTVSATGAVSVVSANAAVTTP